MRSYALTDLSWVEVADHLKRETRLIVPVGACDQYGPHLPVGASTVVVEALARDLSTEFGVLCAPIFAFGVNVATRRVFPGHASLREKTLHRALNDLLADWEEQGFTEFILITAHPFDPHLEALATVAVMQARIRVINALAVDVPRAVEGESGIEHGGEILTSLLLHLRPGCVNLEAAVDFPPPRPRFPSVARQRLKRVPTDSPGSVGWPTRATAEAGQGIYALILQKIREKVFLSPDDTEL